jgi:protein-tyrosine phosphatase
MDLLRSLVSQGRHRYRDEHLQVDLDLTYITSRLVAMGIPKEGVAAAYRNHIDDVVLLLDTKHNRDYAVFNLAEEHDYDYDRFHGQVQEFKWKDHHAPTLAKLFDLIVAMLLVAIGKHTAVVHCQAGKGRTGVAIASFLVYIGVWEHAQHALDFFALKRSANRRAVNKPSQIKYVGYVEKIVHHPFKPHPHRLILKAIELNGAVNCDGQNGFIPVIEILFENSKRLSEVKATKRVEGARFPKNLRFTIPTRIELCGDILVRFKHSRAVANDYLGRSSFHTGFVTGNSLVIQKSDLDDGNQDARIPDTFEIVLVFEIEENAEPVDTAWETALSTLRARSPEVDQVRDDILREIDGILPLDDPLRPHFDQRP